MKNFLKIVSTVLMVIALAQLGFAVKEPSDFHFMLASIFAVSGFIVLLTAFSISIK